MIVCRNDHASLIPTLIRSRALLELFYTPLEKSKDSHSSQRRHSLFSLNAVVDEEVTPLHISSGSGSIACLKVLVDDFNYDVNLRTDTGEVRKSENENSMHVCSACKFHPSLFDTQL